MANPDPNSAHLDAVEQGSTGSLYCVLLRLGIALLVTYYDDTDYNDSPSNVVDHAQLELYDTRILDRIFTVTVKDPEARYVKQLRNIVIHHKLELIFSLKRAAWARFKSLG
jgi:hypothetical protein